MEEEAVFLYYNDRITYEELARIIGEDEAKGHDLLKEKIERIPNDMPDKKTDSVYHISGQEDY